MLQEIRIRGLGVIAEAEFGLSAGLTVVTGETGAGKTMVVTSIGLLSGQRADPALVRAGHGTALVEGTVILDKDHPAITRALEAGAELDEGALLLGRSVAAAGRSRAYAGGHAVPATVLAELADDFIAVHGQSDQQLLLQPSRQRAALDRYAGRSVGEPLAAYAAAYDRHHAVTAELDRLAATLRQRAQEADLLAFGLREIETIDPQPGEDSAVDAELVRLEHADSLRAAAELARAALTTPPDATESLSVGSAVELVARARGELATTEGHDGTLDALGMRIASASYELEDIAAELGSYLAGLNDDPLRLARLQERRASLRGLERKYGPTVDDVLAWRAQARERVAIVTGSDDKLESLRGERETLRLELARLAGEVSTARSVAAEAFAQDVTAELAALAMPAARVRIRLTHEDDEKGLMVGGRRVSFTRAGVDSVALLLQPHPSAPEQPLQRGASGGELARVMLAVEVVFAGADPVATFVFDEVDAGVGGRAAVEVGARLARLAESAQVIVVTHLPQVAAYADVHITVRKSADGTVTKSDVASVDGEERARELARMLAGLEDSDLARAHAEELLGRAAAHKAQRA